MSDILKIVCHTGTVSEITFDQDEVYDMVINTKQDYYIQKLQNRKPLLYLNSQEARIFTITINIKTTDTITKINTLRAQTEPLTLFYEYKNYPGLSACVKIDRQIPIYYAMGLQAANKDIQLTFYEVQPSSDYLCIPKKNIVCSTPNYALSLNGSTQYAYIADNAALTPFLEDCACAVWFKTTSTATPQTFFSKRTGTNRLTFGLENNKVIYELADGTNICIVTSNNNYNDGNWHLAVGISDRSTGLNYLFIDGSYISKSSAAITTTINPSSIFSIGRLASFDIRYFNGTLDEGRFYKFGVNGLYNNGGTFGTNGEIRVGTSSGDLIWSDAAPTNSLIHKLYTEGYDTLTGMGFPSIDNANRTERHNGSGSVAGLVVDKWYMFTQGTAGHNLSGCATLTASGVFKSSATTGTIASGDANDSVKEIGEVARWRMEQNLLDESDNNLDLTGVGTPTYTPHID